MIPYVFVLLEVTVTTFMRYCSCSVYTHAMARE